MRTALLLAGLLFPASLVEGQEKPQAPAAPPLTPFVALRVAITPVQLWRADSAGWSKTVDWAKTRAALDSAIQSVLEERGLGRKWAYASDVARAAKRNPTYASDPFSLGVAKWRNKAPEAGEVLPGILADNLRSITALGDARYALIPIELRAAGDGVILRLMLADTRTRQVVWAGDLASPAGAQLTSELATRVANLIIAP